MSVSASKTKKNRFPSNVKVKCSVELFLTINCFSSINHHQEGTNIINHFIILLYRCTVCRSGTLHWHAMHHDNPQLDDMVCCFCGESITIDQRRESMESAINIPRERLQIVDPLFRPLPKLIVVGWEFTRHSRAIKNYTVPKLQRNEAIGKNRKSEKHTPFHLRMI